MISRVDTIRILEKAPGCPACVNYVSNKLDALQNVVRGKIEFVQMGSDWGVICNEEGRLLNLKYNCEVCGVEFVGKIAIVSTKGEDFDDFVPTMEFKENFPQLWRSGYVKA